MVRPAACSPTDETNDDTDEPPSSSRIRPVAPSTLPCVSACVRACVRACVDGCGTYAPLMQHKAGREYSSDDDED